MVGSGRRIIVLCSLVCVLSHLPVAGLIESQVLAGGFLVEAQDVRASGRAHAGAVAAADSVSTIFFNPAGLTELPGPEGAAMAHIVRPQATVRDRGSTTRTPGSNGAPVSLRGSEDDPFSAVPIPEAFVALPLMDGSVWLGLGAAAPFGLVTDYGSDFFGRYDSTYTRLTVVNVAPAVALKIASWLSVGAGIDIQYANGAFENAIPDPLAPGGPTPESDARFRFEADDWSLGFNLGVLLKPLSRTRVGLHYRSAIEHNLEGDATISGLTGPLTQLNQTSHASAALNLPDILSFGAAHEVTPAFTVLGHISYVGWAKFRQVRIRFADERPDAVSLQNYRNSWALGLGAQYGINDDLMLRTGFKFDQTPTVDGFRTTRVPDGNRYWAAVGASYSISKYLTLDTAYAHLFVGNARIDLDRSFFEGTPLSVSTTIKGIARGSIDIYSAQLRVQF